MRGAVYGEMVEKDFVEVEKMEGAREAVEAFWREGMAKPGEIAECMAKATLVEREMAGVFEDAKEVEAEPKLGDKRKGKAKADKRAGGIEGGSSFVLCRPVRVLTIDI